VKQIAEDEQRMNNATLDLLMCSYALHDSLSWWVTVGLIALGATIGGWCVFLWLMFSEPHDCGGRR